MHGREKNIRTGREKRTKEALHHRRCLFLFLLSINRLLPLTRISLVPKRLSRILRKLMPIL